MQTLRTGELARRANVNVETLRFYERQGLLPKPPQRASGYREYPLEAVGLVQFIKRAQVLGFSLREVTELLDLRQVPRATCGDVVVLARRKIEEIDAKMSNLRAMRMALHKLLKGCTGTAPIAQCPIIESLVDKLKPQGKPRLASGKGAEKLHGNRRNANCCR
jgi:MerR family mercuric resistance operon transcriptional regulator